MTTLTERLWAQYTDAKLAALEIPTAANQSSERECLAAFTIAFLKADEEAAA